MECPRSIDHRTATVAATLAAALSFAVALRPGISSAASIDSQSSAHNHHRTPRQHALGSAFDFRYIDGERAYKIQSGEMEVSQWCKRGNLVTAEFPLAGPETLQDIEVDGSEIINKHVRVCHDNRLKTSEDAAIPLYLYGGGINGDTAA